MVIMVKVTVLDGKGDMTTAIDKTQKLERTDLAIDLLQVNAKNPNKMNDREFDLLVDNMQEVGITDPLIVRPLGDGKYRIVGGHHRFKAAKYLGFDTVPCTVIKDPDFDEERETFQLIRHNAIHGQIDPAQFIQLYYEYADKYSDEVIQDSFGFADEKEFKKLINEAAKTLPQEMQGKFKEAAKELKTIDDLAKLLNTMFTKYGDTLPYGYMVIDYGGKQSLWVQISQKTYKALNIIGQTCIDNDVTLDDVIGGVVQRIAKGDLSELVEEIISTSPKVEIPDGMQAAPTKANIEEQGVFNDL